MGLMADRAATRMQTRQMYRTASRMQRRRSWMEERIGARQDPAAPAGEPDDDGPAREANAPPPYLAELEQLARLRDDGVISPAEFDAKKRQLLGI